MTHSAAQEYFGGSIVATISSAYTLRRPNGVNGCRCYRLTCSSTPDVFLPDARDLPGGSTIAVFMAAASTSPAQLRNHAGTSLLFLSAPNGYLATLVSGGTEAGVWHVENVGSPALGPLAALGTQTVVVDLLTSRNNVDVPGIALETGQWDGESPVVVRITVGPGVVIGSTDTGLLALAASPAEWPAGSTTLLHMHPGSYISGRGGKGGRGGDVPPGLLPIPGGAGGPALYLGSDAFLVGSGTIQGGGGGGGGGSAVGASPGSGGGGGAGWTANSGGAGGVNAGTGTVAPAGTGGGLTVPGTSPVLVPGTGGGNGGQPGNPGGGNGGLAGNAISTATGYTVDKTAWTGTIFGPEVFV